MLGPDYLWESGSLELGNCGPANDFRSGIEAPQPASAAGDILPACRDRSAGVQGRPLAKFGHAPVPCGGMSTPLPGQIRCPTCQRSTPPAAFCTQCGTAIPASARARPRGLDREELQDRIRTHRPGDAAFRRGSMAGETSGQGASPYQPYRPEPEDELILPEPDADAIGDARVDNTPPGFDDQPPPVVVAVPLAAVAQSARAAPPAPAAHAAQVIGDQARPSVPQWSPPDEPFDPAQANDNRYRTADDGWDRRGSGVSPLAIGGFVLLGVLAIAVGAFVSGIFSGAAVASPSPTPVVSVMPSAISEPTVAPTASASVPASSTAASGSPGPFADGFTARAQPCAEKPTSADGCGSSGASVSGGTVWAWVGFRKASSSDVLGITVTDASGASVGDGSLPLTSINCTGSCGGWAYFKFGGLAPGNYTIRVNRNGQPAAEARFTVTG